MKQLFIQGQGGRGKGGRKKGAVKLRRTTPSQLHVCAGFFRIPFRFSIGEILDDLHWGERVLGADVTNRKLQQQSERAPVGLPQRTLGNKAADECSPPTPTPSSSSSAQKKRDGRELLCVICCACQCSCVREGVGGWGSGWGENTCDAARQKHTL